MCATLRAVVARTGARHAIRQQVEVTSRDAAKDKPASAADKHLRVSSKTAGAP
jgi:hypothetical protein